ncbi:MAG: hypothetical protein MUD14_27665 [Hydrococcus sp. Prado102]|nr:hypothetical protein [Hydrococcus sp. Prado102]
MTQLIGAIAQFNPIRSNGDRFSVVIPIQIFTGKYNKTRVGDETAKPTRYFS